jgi:predicted nucleic acid-binding protein
LSLDLDRLLRRLKPEKRTAPLVGRPVPELVAAGRTAPRCPLVPDTTVYIHAGQGKLPVHVAAMVRDWPLRHCSVALGEIAHALGRLDPGHPQTPARRACLEDLLRRIPSHRLISPDPAAHLQAGILTGILARLQGLPASAHRQRLNDLLILVTAQQAGAAVLTANVGDFDLAQQLLPEAGVVFYQAEPA